ncbi:MAG: hypothetical protein QOF51_142 [Chloroflexota bacterium]|jgi:hypothetical protein|nr:hypothetical protein [Chloroflexota bacterium]
MAVDSSGGGVQFMLGLLAGVLFMGAGIWWGLKHRR